MIPTRLNLHLSLIFLYYAPLVTRHFENSKNWYGWSVFSFHVYIYSFNSYSLSHFTFFLQHLSPKTKNKWACSWWHAVLSTKSIPLKRGLFATLSTQPHFGFCLHKFQYPLYVILHLKTFTLTPHTCRFYIKGDTGHSGCCLSLSTDLHLRPKYKTCYGCLQTIFHSNNGSSLLRIMTYCLIVASNHYLNQCRYILKRTLGNKCQWNFCQENELGNVIYKLAANLSWPKCVIYMPHNPALITTVNPASKCKTRGVPFFMTFFLRKGTRVKWIYYTSNYLLHVLYTLPAMCVESPYLCYPFASQLMKIYVNINIRSLTINKRPFATNWQTLIVDQHFYSVPVSLLSRECWFPQLPQRQCGTFVLITFSCQSYANYHLRPKWQPCQPISDLLLLKVLFSSQVLGFLRGRCR